MDIPAVYVGLLQLVEDATGFNRPLLHVHCGLLIYVSAQLVLADRRASVLAVAWVAFLAVMNEVVEAIHYGSPRWDDTLADLALTLAWPVILVILGAYRRRRWARGQIVQRKGPFRTGLIPLP